MSNKKKFILFCIFIVCIYFINVFAKNFYESIYGNEEKRRMTYEFAEKYINEKYPNSDYIIEDVYYFNVSAYYIAQIKSLSSIDTYFEVAFQDDKVVFDNYEDNVKGKYNVYKRLEKHYSKIVDDVFKLSDFPFKTDIFFGRIILRREKDTTFYEPKYGLDKNTLEIDKKYDIRDFARISGKIVLDVQKKDINYDEAARLLLELKQYLDEKDIPFYAINFSLEKEGNKDDMQNIRIVNFLYSDIYEQDLSSRIEKADEEYKKFVEGENEKRISQNKK